MEVIPKRLHRRREIALAVPGQADAHGRDLVGDAHGFDAFAFQ